MFPVIIRVCPPTVLLNVVIFAALTVYAPSYTLVPEIVTGLRVMV